MSEDNIDDSVIHFENLLVNNGHKEGLEVASRMATNEGFESGNRKGRELALEFGFYYGVLKSLREIQKQVASKDHHGVAVCLPPSASQRDKEIAKVCGRIRQENIMRLCESLETMLGSFLNDLDGFTDEVFQHMIRIRAKFKVLESRLGLVFDVTPDTSTLKESASNMTDLLSDKDLTF